MSDNRVPPIGTPCRYYPVPGDSSHIKSKTRSEVWVLEDGRAVIMIEGKSGCVAMSHIELEP